MAKFAVAGGHSKKAPGASSYIDEYTEDRKVVAALVKELKSRGHAVTDCSNEQTTQSKELAAEVTKANASSASLFNAIHFNAASKTSGKRGVEVWYYKGSAEGKKRAVAIAKALSKALGLPNRGAKATTSLYVLRRTSMTAVLTEVCFVDAKGDVDAYRALGAAGVARAIADGMCGTSTASSAKPSGGSSPASKPGSSGGSSPAAGYYKAFSSGSIVDGLKSIGVDSSFANRKKIAAANGISGYEGTAAQNTRLCELAGKGKLKKPGSSSSSSSATYYKKFSSSSIVDGLKSIGVDSSFANRKKIAKANGIGGYTGTAAQNEKLCSLAKQGKLKKA